MISAGQICTVEGLTCLARKGWPGNITANCECPKPCTEVLFVREIFKRHRWSVDGSGITFVRKTACRWEILSPNFRLRRDVLFSFEDLLGEFTSKPFLALTLNLIYIYSIIRWHRNSFPGL